MVRDFVNASVLLSASCPTVRTEELGGARRGAGAGAAGLRLGEDRRGGRGGQADGQNGGGNATHGGKLLITRGTVCLRVREYKHRVRAIVPVGDEFFSRRKEK